MSDTAPQPAVTPSSPPTPFWRRRSALGALVIVISLALGLYFLLPDLIYARTDDAYVEGHIELISARVPGHVLTLHVDDNSPVKQGEVMLELDPRDFTVKVEAAEANLAAAQSRLAEARSEIAIAASQISVATAEAESAAANSHLADDDLKRFQGVSDVRAVSTQRLDTARSAAESARAALDAARTRVDLAKNQADLARVQVATAEAGVAQAKAALDQAELDLSYSHVIAPEDGSVANKLVELGNYVQPGQTLLSLVPTKLFVIANFKETQVDDIAAGGKATVTVDSFPGLRLRGHVDSIQRGSGSRFALLPPENATGNFVKIVQRIPVKILLDEPPEALARLAPGMSVIVSVSSP
jgi:membrane fusion protein (multidrug efflux system)